MPSTRTTNHSLSSAAFSPEPSSSATTSSLAYTSSAPSPPSSVVTPLGGASAVDPNFLAAVVDAVKLALLPESSSSSSLPATVPGVAVSSATALPLPVPGIGGVPSQAADLGARATALFASGAGFSSPFASAAPTASQGRPAFVVPSFVTTFSAPLNSITTPATGTSHGSWPVPLGNVASSSSLPSVPILNQPFVVGPGFSPIPAKTVGQILAGKFVDLSDLLSANISQAEPEGQVLLDGRLVFTPSTKKQRRRVEDIVTWSEAFTIYSMIVASHFPHRWQDLTQYKLLILRTYRQFNGRVWLAYDQAFREHAAAVNLTNWSSINVQLFNFHAAGASVRGGQGSLARDATEPSGSSTSQVICRSWNAGRCSASFSSCRFAHRCSICAGSHRSSSCSERPESRTTRESKRRSASPAPYSASQAKSKRS